MTKEDLLVSIERLKEIIDVPWPKPGMSNEDNPEEVTMPIWILENFAEVSKFLRDAETYLMKDK